MTKAEILADLRNQFGPGLYLYANDIAVLLNKSIAAVYELIKRKGGLPWPIKLVGKRPAVSLYDVAESMADDAVKEKPPEPGKPVLPLPKHKVNKELTKALSLLRVQQQFIDQVCSEIEAQILQNNVAVNREPTEESSKKPPKTTKIRV